MRTFLMITLAIGFPLAVVLANEAQAVQDTPATINGVETVCTGVGSAKDDPRWSAYPVKVVLATTAAPIWPMPMSASPRAARKSPGWIATRPGSCSSRAPAATP